MEEGWPGHELSSPMFCQVESFIWYGLGPCEMQHLMTLYGYSCRLLGLPVGSACRSHKHPPRHTGSFLQEDDVEKNRPRAPDHQQSSCNCRRTPTPTVTGMHASTGPASDGEPPHPPAPEVRGMDHHGAWWRGSARRRGCLRTPAPPRASCGRVEVRDDGMPGVGRGCGEPDSHSPASGHLRDGCS